ncbi:hypothetical protein PIROE2DRAFT_6175 [Piromyces sp. E2]|nr:hypothetical protein PIROE2DRAFT_6175 [Piromyces sp. E2]|eukprot:OUM66554.1 hypothetical protein PIROE2DRAFT_6175 [Piromyces sp. E2]
MLNLKLVYLLLITLFANKVFCDYYITKSKETRNTYYIAKMQDDRTYLICKNIFTQVGVCNHDRCSDNVDLLYNCIDHKGNYNPNTRYGPFDVYNPWSCPFAKKLFDACTNERVYINDTDCYISAVPGTFFEKTNKKAVKGYYNAVAFYNNRALTEFGWCKYEK